jgi:radical SAM superfamily enzyme YgiQ (UPF0313 family)
MNRKIKVVLISTDEGLSAIGVRTVSSCLIEHGFETVIIVMSTMENNFSMFYWADLDNLCDGAGLIGISCMTHGLKKAIEVKEHLWNKFRVPIIIGGIHASISPEGLFNDFDLICHGEGEDVAVELARRISDNEPYHNIPGLLVKDGNSVIRNQAIDLKKALDCYPFPDYDFNHQFFLKASHLVQIVPNSENIDLNGFVILGSRGCPHSCTYCCNEALKKNFPWVKYVRHYSVDYLINHLKEVRRHIPIVRQFWIGDDTFFAKGFNEILDFSERYKNEINKPFTILISPWTFDDNKIKPLLDAGMNRMIIGVQSGSEKTTNYIYNRKLSKSRILDIGRQLHKYSSKMLICYDFIGMNPFEESDDLISTIEFIKNLPSPFRIYNNNLAFYPGTVLYKKAIEAGFDTSIRIKHTEATIGYSILRKEKIQHKIFHFLLLMMAGYADNMRIGWLPRFAISGHLILFYRFIDMRLNWVSNYFVSIVASVLYCTTPYVIKIYIKRALGPKTIARLRLLNYRLLHRENAPTN